MPIWKPLPKILQPLGIALVMAISGSVMLGADPEPRNANALSNTMPIRWEHAYVRVIADPDLERLAAGEILTEIKRVGDDVVMAQSMGRIRAGMHQCYQVVSTYDHYCELMPYTVESRVVRSFSLESPHAGADAVDFWTRIRVFGFNTGYLLRIAHPPESDLETLGIFWTLVDTPDQVAGCRDAQGRPCRNDLSVNMGSHRFEPFPGQPDFTLHTYTLILSGTRWYQQAALRMGARQSAAQVIESIRNALACPE